MILNKKAFTLAEVLITLGIIGVVAALTLPTLIQNYKEKQTVTQLKKTYSVVQQAMLRAVDKHGDIASWDFAAIPNEKDDDGNVTRYYAQEKLLEYLADALNVIKSSEYINTTRCDINGERCSTGKRPCIVLNDGTLLAVSVKDSSDIIDDQFGGITVFFSNCVKTKCSDGVDTFLFNIYKKGNKIKPTGADEWSRARTSTYCNPKSTDRQNGAHCATWIIDNENMDYLH